MYSSYKVWITTVTGIKQRQGAWGTRTHSKDIWLSYKHLLFKGKYARLSASCCIPRRITDFNLKFFSTHPCMCWIRFIHQGTGNYLPYHPLQSGREHICGPSNISPKGFFTSKLRCKQWKHRKLTRQLPTGLPSTATIIFNIYVKEIILLG